MLLNLSPEHIRASMHLYRSAYEYKPEDGTEEPIDQPEKMLRQFMNVSRGWGDMMRSSTPEEGKEDAFNDFSGEIYAFHSWATEELRRIEHSREKKSPNPSAERLAEMAKLNEASRVLEGIPGLKLLNPDEQIIAEFYAAECIAAAIERDKEFAARPPVPEPPPSLAVQRLLDEMPPWEQYSTEHLERIRLLDALQSLKSPLSWAKKERLGIERYLKKFTTSRVR
jgi:hypothetical protein